MDKALAQAINLEITAALDAIAAKHGLLFKRGGCSFGTDSFRRSIELNTPAVGGTGVAKKFEDSFATYASMFGVPTDCLGKTFTSGRSTLKIVGLDPNKPKNCVMLQDVSTMKMLKCAPGYLSGLALSAWL